MGPSANLGLPGADQGGSGTGIHSGHSVLYPPGLYNTALSGTHNKHRTSGREGRDFLP